MKIPQRHPDIKGIAFAGPRGAGKSFIAEAVKQLVTKAYPTNNVTVFNNSDPIRQLCASANPPTSESLFTDKWDTYKDLICPKLSDELTPREILANFNKRLREAYGNFAVDNLATNKRDSIIESPDSFLILPDLRQEPEAKWCQANNVIVVEILSDQTDLTEMLNYFNGPFYNHQMDNLHFRIPNRYLDYTLWNNQTEELSFTLLMESICKILTVLESEQKRLKFFASEIA